LIRLKRLAVEVEDHPLEYGRFEGTIPRGQSGGGTVQLWERGTWTRQGANPQRELADGHSKVVMDGERMRGKGKQTTDPFLICAFGRDAGVQFSRKSGAISRKTYA
jgi:DNA ligase D-like protein (predicted 3'-phosphoesterase)